MKNLCNHPCLANFMKKTIQDFKSLDRHYRANLINSIIGIKQASLIGTYSKSSVSNLALFSSAVHLGSNPPLVAIFSRPAGSSPKQTMENIILQKYYTINHVNESIVSRAHSCSFNFPANISEFDACKLTEEKVNGFNAPFVKECSISLGICYRRHFPLEENGVFMIIGRIEALFVNDEIVQDNGEVDLSSSHSVGVAGNNTYYKLDKHSSHAYLKKSQKNTLTDIVSAELEENTSNAR